MIDASAMIASLLEKLREEEDDDDDDDDDDDLICPITSVTFQKPMKSTKCGHTFSHAAIAAMLRGRPDGIQCPLFGCRHQILAADLQADKEKERELRRAARPPRADGEGDGADAPPLPAPHPHRDRLRSIAAAHTCSSTRALIVDPVVASDGHLYEVFASSRRRREENDAARAR